MITGTSKYGRERRTESVQLLTEAGSVLKSSVFFWAQINTNASVFAFEGKLIASLKAQN
jgi:hypothetical protein